MNHLPATQTPVQRDAGAADASGPEAGFYADDDPRPPARPASRLHPLVMAAAISTIALSATGVAWFAGLLPSSPGAQSATAPATAAPTAAAAPTTPSTPVTPAPQPEVAAAPVPTAPAAATPAPVTTPTPAPAAPKVAASTPKHKTPAHHAAAFDDEELRSHGTPRRYSDSTGTWREPAGVRHVQYYSSSDGRAPIYYEDRNQGYQSAPPPPPSNYQQGYQQGYPQQNYQPAYNSAPPVCRDCGTVENVHVVQQRGEASGAGAVAGGVIGGVLGHQLGNGRGNTAMTVLGAVGGAVAGNQIEKSSRSGSRYEIVVRMDDGSSRVLTQEQPPSLRSGDRVRVNGNGIMPY